MKPRKLTDILAAGGSGNIYDIWNSTTAADEFGPLPPGEYVAKLLRGELENSKSKGTPGFKLEFEIIEGEHTGRRVWHDLWLTEAAMAMTKRDLTKLGVVSLDQLDGALPPGIVCTLKVALRKNDDGTEFNKVRFFDFLRIETPEPDVFAPPVRDGESEGAK